MNNCGFAWVLGGRTARNRVKHVKPPPPPLKLCSSPGGWCTYCKWANQQLQQVEKNTLPTTCQSCHSCLALLRTRAHCHQASFQTNGQMPCADSIVSHSRPTRFWRFKVLNESCHKRFADKPPIKIHTHVLVKGGRPILHGCLMTPGGG